METIKLYYPDPFLLSLIHISLAKYVALHYNELSFPFRGYQSGKVYRGERAQRGRFREF